MVGSVLFYAGLVWLVTASRSMRQLGTRSFFVLLVLMLFSYPVFPVSRPERWKTAPVKAFGIGLSRTGTTTLAANLWYYADYDAIHAPLSFVHYPCWCDQPQAEIDWNQTTYDFVGDIMASFRFESLAQRFPQAKFIYTKRDAREFAESAVAFFGGAKAHLWPMVDTLHRACLFPLPTNRFFADMYGPDYAMYNVTQWMQVYQEYEARVHTFFAKDAQLQQRFLELDITQGQGKNRSWNKTGLANNVHVYQSGWEKLNPFLHLPPDPQRQGPLRKFSVERSLVEQSLWSMYNVLGWILMYSYGGL